MIENITQIFTYYSELIKTNPVAAGLFGVWGLSAVSFLLKEVPGKVFNFIYSQITTDLILHNQDYVFFEFLDWVSKNHTNSFVRSFNINNGVHNMKNKNSLALGFGNVYFIHERSFFKFKREEIEASGTSHTKQKITITLFGRNKKKFDSLFQSVKKDLENKNDGIGLYTYEHGSFEKDSNQKPYRKLSSVILDSDVKKILMKGLNDFETSKKWYKENGIPYKYGILLEGPPGTGKSSLIAAICSELKKDMVLLNLNGISDISLSYLVGNLPPDTILVIEDIDGYNVQLTRQEKNNKSNSLISVTISGLLNAIDGQRCPEDMILIMTTNHAEKLDPALLRKGRVDLRLKLDYMTNSMVEEMFKLFYPNFTLPGFKLNDLPACDVQSAILNNKTSPLAALKQLEEEGKLILLDKNEKT